MKIAFAIYASHYLIFQQKPQPQCQTAVPDCAARTANSQPQSHKPDREARLHSQNREATPRSHTTLSKPRIQRQSHNPDREADCTARTTIWQPQSQNYKARPRSQTALPQPRIRTAKPDHTARTAKPDSTVRNAKPKPQKARHAESDRRARTTEPWTLFHTPSRPEFFRSCPPAVNPFYENGLANVNNHLQLTRSAS